MIKINWPAKKFAVLTAALSFTYLLSCQDGGRRQVLTGDYMGQKKPGLTAEIFAPGIISTGLYERDVAITSDGKEIYYSLAMGKYATIMVARLANERWGEPEVASFASDLQYFNFEPGLSHDGKRMFFLSNRPPKGQEPKPGWGHQNIWVADRLADGSWSEPYDLGSPICTSADEFFPSLTLEGTLYFTRSVAENKFAIFRSRLVNGQYAEPEMLPASVNQNGNPTNAVIAPDESYLVACAAGSQGAGKPAGPRYYVFFRSKEDKWSEGICLGDEINHPGVTAISPSISPDGHYFFFASTKSKSLASAAEKLTLSKILEFDKTPQNGRSDIYWIDAQYITTLREKTF